ncbi:MAG: T9SS type A sorting domain-containing protein [Candidatus Kapabacteria bacterium]|nr:T9SS type A sorting domain-containing protein [Candidatus Kapabacteria bacterium]
MNSQAFSQVWTKVPGTLDYVNFLKFSIHNQEKLFAGSDAIPTDITTNIVNFPFFGYGFQVSSNSGATFSQAKLTDYSIFDIIESGEDASLLMVSARKQDIGRILVTKDGGTTWDEETKRCEGSSQASRFQSASEGDSEVFYAAMLNSTSGFRYSDDLFENCLTTVETNINSRDLAISKSNPKVLYLIGDNVSSARVLCSSDGGQSWQDRSEGLLNYRILSVQVSPLNEAVVVVGADSITPAGRIFGMGVFYSDDYGLNWRHAGAAGASVFDIQYHPTDSRYWAAAGGDKGVLISGTGGDYWEFSTDGLPEDFFARKVAIPNVAPDANGIIVYASIYGNGIYKSNRITTSVKNNDFAGNAELIQTVFPNPAENFISIISEVDLNGLNYDIYNLFGSKLSFGKFGSSNLLNIAELASGTYFLKISQNEKYQLIKFIKN